MGSTVNQRSNPDKLLQDMAGLLKELEQTDSTRQIKEIERKSNSLVSDAIKSMKNSEIEPALVRKLMDLHGKIVMGIDWCQEVPLCPFYCSKNIGKI